MATQKTVNWKSAWNQWPKPAAEVVRALRAAVVGEKAPGSRAAPSLRDPWAQLLMVANNAAQGFDDSGAAGGGGSFCGLGGKAGTEGLAVPGASSP